MKVRAVALLMGALLVAAAPLGAQETRSYVAIAKATALKLTIGGQGLHLGHTTAGIRSGTDQEIPDGYGCEADSLACGTGAAEPNFDQAVATHPGEGEADVTAGALPEDFSPLVTLVGGEARASAAADRASGDSGLISVSVTANQTIIGDEQAEPLREGLREISEQLLGPMAEGDPSGEIGPRLKGTVDTLLSNLAATPLVTIDALPSHSSVIDEGTRVGATAIAKGAVLAISPSPAHTALSPEALIIVEVGAAEVTAWSDGTTESDPAAVRIKIFNPTTGEYDVIPVAAGDFQCGGEDTPLATCVGVGATAEADGSAASGGVNISTLDGQLVLEVGRADVGTSQALAEAPAPGPVPAPAPLPTTGGGLALPALGLLGLGALGVTALRRGAL